MWVSCALKATLPTIPVSLMNPGEPVLVMAKTLIINAGCEMLKDCNYINCKLILGAKEESLKQAKNQNGYK